MLSAGGVVLSGIPLLCLPAFHTVWGGQTERETPLCDIKFHAAHFHFPAEVLRVPLRYDIDKRGKL